MFYPGNKNRPFKTFSTAHICEPLIIPYQRKFDPLLPNAS